MDVKLPTREKLLERVTEKLEEYRKVEREFHEAAKARSLGYALVWKDPVDTAAGLSVYGDIYAALTDPDSKATPESLYEFIQRTLITEAAINSPSTNVMSNEISRAKLACLADTLNTFGIFGVD